MSSVNSSQAAYVAGIIDGEGSISLVQSFAKRTKGKYVYPLVRVANTSQALIDWLEANVSERSSRQYRSAMNERCKPVYHIGWASTEALSLLTEVLPYLVIKRAQADLVIALDAANRKAGDGKPFGHGHPIPDELLALRLDFFRRMQKLNQRGVVDEPADEEGP